MLDLEIHCTINTPRGDSLLHSNQQKKKRIPLVITWHPTLSFLAQATRCDRTILGVWSVLGQIFASPWIILFWHPKSLRDLPVHTTLTSATRNVFGSFLCGARRSKTWPPLWTTDMFTSYTTGKQFTTSVTCLTQWKMCGAQNAGKTGQPLNWGMNGHWSDIAHGRTEESPVAAHFNWMDHVEADLLVLVNDRRPTAKTSTKKIVD